MKYDFPETAYLHLSPFFWSSDALFVIFGGQKVDATWRIIMSNIGESANVVETASQAGLLEKFQECVGLLDRINKGLNAYLEKKRLFFPR